MIKPVKTTPPRHSKAESLARDAYFYDAWAIPAANPALDPLEQFLRVLRATPPWVDHLMVLRNRVVGLLGLKDLGELSGVDVAKPSVAYVEGERVGIFTLIEKGECEVLLGDDDKHLNVVVSVHKEENASSGETIVTVSTVVHVKNWLGRMYMLPVAPAHHVIARAMTKKIGESIP